MTDWRDLSSVELRVRLSQRGIPTDTARWLVDHRDDFDGVAAEAIDIALAR